jgi:uncharacterized protein
VDDVGRLVGSHVYPVKSMRGTATNGLSLRSDGVAGDRRYALVDVATGNVASAKQPRAWRSLLDCVAGVDRDGHVLVQLPDGSTCAIGDDRLLEAIHRLTGRQVGVAAAKAGALGRYDSTWPEVEGVTLSGPREFAMALNTDAVRFVDVAGLHVLTTSTLQALQRLAPGSDVHPARFRPNLVIDTPMAGACFLEDAWVGRTLQVGQAARIRIASKAPRCVMTTLGQPGLDPDPMILRAAATNRRHFDGVGTLACAGVYAEVVTPGDVRNGDRVVLA